MINLGHRFTVARKRAGEGRHSLPTADASNSNSTTGGNAYNWIAGSPALLTSSLGA